MTQTFTNILPTDNVGQSLDPIKDRDQANKTNFMGTSLPAVTEDDIGMQAVVIKTENGVDYKQVWRLIGFADAQPQWMLERDLTRGIVYTGTSSDSSIVAYQPLNALLTSLSDQVAEGNQSNANTIPYLSGTNEFSLAQVTTLARQFLAAADAATARGVLGLGSLATKSTVTGADIGVNAVQLNNMAKGTINKIISYNASGNPILVDKPAGVPVGVVMMYPSTALPDNTWIFCYGQQLTTTDYPELWDFASASNNIVADLDEWQNNRPGSFYQESSTVFRVPDLRNYFVRAWDGPTGPTRVVGSRQGDAIRNITGKFPNGNEKNNYEPSGVFYRHATEKNSTAWDGTSHPKVICMDVSLQVPTADENRPVNIVYPFIMKARSQTV